MRQILGWMNGSWKKSTLAVFAICLIIGCILLCSCNIPRMDFAFENGETDGSGIEGGGGNNTVAQKVQVTLAWNSNTEPDLEGYKLYCGDRSRIYNLVIDVGNVTSFTVANLDAGKTYYFSATAYDTVGYESSFSNEIIYTGSL